MLDEMFLHKFSYYQTKDMANCWNISPRINLLSFWRVELYVTKFYSYFHMTLIETFHHLSFCVY